MSVIVQNIVVLVVVLGCLAVVAVQGFSALRGKRSKLGSCCSRGCQPPAAQGKGKTERIVFLPVEMLGKKK